MRWAVLGHEEKTVAAGYGEGFRCACLNSGLTGWILSSWRLLAKSGGGISLGNAVGFACGAADAMQRQAVVRWFCHTRIGE
jgi:hypothetical protein